MRARVCVGRVRRMLPNRDAWPPGDMQPAVRTNGCHVNCVGKRDAAFGRDGGLERLLLLGLDCLVVLGARIAVLRVGLAHMQEVSDGLNMPGGQEARCEKNKQAGKTRKRSEHTRGVGGGGGGDGGGVGGGQSDDDTRMGSRGVREWEAPCKDSRTSLYLLRAMLALALR